LSILFGAHCYLFTDRWSDDQLNLMDQVKGLGLDLWEIAVGDDVSFDPSLTGDHAKALGLTLTASPGGIWPIDCDLSADEPDHRSRGLRWHERQVDLAAEMGAIAYTGAIYGHPGIVRRRPLPIDELRRTADGLHELADYGAERGVQIVLEPMSHFRTHLINTPEQLMTLIELAGHDNLMALLDTYHVVTEIRDYGQAIRLLAPRLWGLHACENDRGVPGDGLVPWSDVFGALKAIGFDGAVLMETYNSSIGDPSGSFAYARGMFHDPCPSGAAFVRKGLAFLKQGLGDCR
jgi:D-psicose/D-tagatose/L-ribulose 3-epimerase